MEHSNWEEILFNKLQSLQNSNSGIIDMNHIDVIIAQFLEILKYYLTNSQKEEIYYQIENILLQISELKKDISNLNAEILHDNFIPEMEIELESIIMQTEESVSGILDTVDKISEIAKKIQDDQIRGALLHKVTKILELCNFQDLTGQRIQKIIYHLSKIESIIFKMLHALRPENELKIPDHDEKNKSLLNGPQKKEDTPSQEDIDQFFK
jgi:chemotaxis protein CheZ